MNCSPSSLMYGARCQRCLPRGALPALTTWLLCQFANKPRTLCGDPVIDAQALVYLNDYLRRVAINGGAAVSQNNQDAIHVFLCTLIQNGIDTQVISMCCFAPEAAPTVGNYIAAATPVIVTSGNDPWLPYTWGNVLIPWANVAQNFTLGANGLRDLGTLANGYMRTGVNFVTVGGSFFSLATSVTELVGNPDMFTLAGMDAGGESSICHRLAGARFYRSWGLGANGQITEAVADQNACFLCGSRRAANDFSFYQGLGGVFRVVGNKNTTLSAIPNLEHYLFGLNNAGAIQFVWTGTISFAALMKPLTQSQAQALYTAVNTMRNSMGGGAI